MSIYALNYILNAHPLALRSSTAVALVLGCAVGISVAASSLIAHEVGVEFNCSAGSPNRVGHDNRVGLHSLQRLAGDLLECLLDADALLGRRFVEGDAVVGVAPLLALPGVDLALLLAIDFVAEDHERERLGVLRGCVVDETLFPLGQIFEGFLARDVIDQHAAVGSSVESVAERLELLLARGIPDLQCYYLVID